MKSAGPAAVFTLCAFHEFILAEARPRRRAANVGRWSDDVSLLSRHATGNSDLDQFEWILAPQPQS